MANTNPGFNDGQVVDASVWNSTFAGKVDATNGVLTTPAISGGGSFAGTFTGVPTFSAGIVVPNNITLGGTLVASGANTPLVFAPAGTGGHQFAVSGGGDVLILSGSTSALANQVTVAGATTGGHPTITATGSDTNVSLFLSGKGGALGGAVQVNQSPFAIETGPITLSGTVVPSIMDFTASINGTISPLQPEAIVNFKVVDTASKPSSNAPIPTVQVTKNWGTGALGQQTALRVLMQQSGPTSETSATSAQYNPLTIIGQYNYNVGGTSSTAGLGAAYTFYPTVSLLAGATYYEYASNAEFDENIVGSTQPLTLSGTVTTGDVINLVFTSTSIVGSPLTVSYTFASGNTLGHAVAGLMAAIQNNAALANAGVSASFSSIGSNVLNIFWQGQFTTTLAASVSGAQTETAALGTFVQGASTGGRDNISFAALGSGRAYFTDFTSDACVKFATLKATTGASYYTLLLVGSGPATFPIAPGGRIFATVPQITYLNNSYGTGPIFAPQLSVGFDLGNINFTQWSGFAYQSPGYQVDAVGSVYIGNAKLSAESTGLTIDTPNYTGSGNPTIVSGGGGGSGTTVGNYYVGDIGLWNGGQFLVTGVNASTGAVTSLVTLVQPWSTAAWSGTISGTAIKGLSGTGLSMTVPCQQNTLLTLNPSGSTLTGKGSAGATTDTSGHLLIPFVVGAPTGVPANASAGIALRYDTTNHKLWAYDNGTSTWKGIVLT